MEHTPLPGKLNESAIVNGELKKMWYWLFQENKILTEDQAYGLIYMMINLMP
ncbi:hypothetical protein B7P43_G15232 [Cryptotermes secundus]|uniref:Uncharacterized protein n=1 Tax=Cryptotermes secundus TaxID=105785 RepID=A0A2J7QIS0_9NEOP|nr:hypothetical protein B7P43_G15232 [Cryptotermes secundus]